MKKLALFLGVLAMLVFAGALCEQTSDVENVNDVNVNEEIVTAGYTESNVATLVAVADVPGDGTAIRGDLIEGGNYSLSIGANLPNPHKDFFYEGWLVLNGTEVSVGMLEKIQGTWVLDFESGTDYMDYSQVVVTQETTANGLDGVAETPILEGEFIAGQGEDEEMVICHKPGTPAENTMTINGNNWPGHEAHGDYLGPCTDEDED
ncbi:hypothetical protein KKC88_06295 [Patescibacteria group bacterium]|nr:hypothetical protein [Patescibacteria group bacterium]MBU1673908.1 hypothetical protein [Patescibacteria group bacterium]MBU1963902.1 hypothetical protein [Patescibacteria group bacterium]